MNPGDFNYELPEELIAQAPLPDRKSSRLMYLSRDAADPEDLQFSAINHLLRPGDLLVVNDTRVLPARLLGRKASGGKEVNGRVASPRRPRQANGQENPDHQDGDQETCKLQTLGGTFVHR